MVGQRLIAAAFRMYPSWWRTRYLEEVQGVTNDLLAAGRSSWALSLNLFLAALRTRVRAAGMPKSYELWARRTNASVALGSAAGLVAFVVLATIRERPSPKPPPVIPFTGASTTASMALLVSSLLLIAVLIGGYAALARGVREPQMGNRRALRLLARAPIYLLASSVALLVASDIVHPHHYGSQGGHWIALDGQPLVAALLSDAAGATFLTCLAAGALLLVLAARFAKLLSHNLVSGVSIARIIAVLLWLMTAATSLLCLLGSGESSVAGGYITVSQTEGSLVTRAVLFGVLACVATLASALAGPSLRNAVALTASSAATTQADLSSQI